MKTEMNTCKEGSQEEVEEEGAGWWRVPLRTKKEENHEQGKGLKCKSMMSVTLDCLDRKKMYSMHGSSYSNLE